MVGCGLGDAAGSVVGVGSMAVGDGLVGTATVTVGVGGIAAGGDVGAQAATKTTARLSTMI